MKGVMRVGAPAGTAAFLVLACLVACRRCRLEPVPSDQAANGFVSRTIVRPDGSKAKFVVFVPHHAKPGGLLPTILFLHGAGNIGNDGAAQISGGLALAIRKQEPTFPFLVVFPQAESGSWLPTSSDGQLALEMLNLVQQEYPVDRDRLYLTGYSMGGEGTWSLAASDPQRWAAIVPICPGRNQKLIPKLIDIPCWCFQGDADSPELVQNTRVMMQELKRAGGRPIYHEWSGVGHHCWDATYSLAELYDWLLVQRRSEQKRSR